MMDHEERVVAKSLGAVMDICKRWRETAKVGLISSLDQSQGCSGGQCCTAFGSVVWVQVQVFFTVISMSCCYLVTKSCSTLFDSMYVACQAPLSMGFSRQEY